MAKRLATKELSCNDLVTLVKFLCSFGVKAEKRPLPMAGNGNVRRVRHWSIQRIVPRDLSLITEINCA